MFNDHRSYIYNKAFAAAFSQSWNKEDRFELIRQWAQLKAYMIKEIAKHSMLN